jgi:cytochrome c-type biogenesis protein CcmE
VSATVRLGIVASLVVATTIYMAYVGMVTGWSYYLTVDECLTDAAELVQQRMRVSGKVAVGSLEIVEGRQLATFRLSGTGRDLPVTCTGPLPDNLAEEMEVVVEGRLDESGVLRGDKVLTRCASKYTSQTKTASAVRPAGSAVRGRR